MWMNWTALCGLGGLCVKKYLALFCWDAIAYSYLIVSKSQNPVVGAITYFAGNTYLIRNKKSRPKE